jgi:hypothetical protein
MTGCLTWESMNVPRLGIDSLSSPVAGNGEQL